MSMRSVVAAVLAVVYGAEAQEWSQDATTGCFYKHVAEPQTWFAAIRHCHVSEQASELVALGSESEAQFVASLSPTTTWVDGSFDEGSWNVGTSLWQPSQPGNFREAVHLCAKQPAAGHKLATEACSAQFAFVCKMCGSNPTVAPAAAAPVAAAAVPAAATPAAAAPATPEKPQPVPQQRRRVEVVEAVEAVRLRGRRDETTTSTTTGAAGVSSTTSTITGAAGVSSTTTTTTGAAGVSSTTSTTTGAAGVSSTTTTTTAAAGSTTTTTTTAAAGVSSTTTTTTTGAPGSSTTTTSTAAPEHPAEGDAIPAPAGPAGPGSPGMGPGDVPVAFPPRQGVLVDGTDNTPVDEAGVATAAPLSAGIIALIISAGMAALVAVAVVARHATKEDEADDEAATEAGCAQAPQAPAVTAFEDPVVELQWDDSL